MKQHLKRILQSFEKDFGEEIFSQENASRFRRALKREKSIANDMLLFANIKGIPQEIYDAKKSALDFSSSEKQQEQILKNCYQDLINAQMLPDSAYEVISAFAEIFALPQISQFECQKELGDFIYKDKIYKTCRIGNIVWMAENFLVMGNEWIGPGSTPWSMILGLTIPKSESACGGKLVELASYEKAVRCAPQGWRLPTVADFQDLIYEIKDATNKPGAALKATSKWKKGLDLFGFNAIPIKMDDGSLAVNFGLKGDSGDSELPRLCFSLDDESDEIQFRRTEADSVNCIRYVKDV